MKTKFVLIGVAVALVAAGGWFGWAAWRAQRQLVTLNVYQAPLSEVLRRIERQTWQKVRAENALDAKITLNVKNQPLTNVLDKIAMQAGARWSTVFAVFRTKSALSGLESALGSSGKIEDAGWAKVAPKARKMEMDEPMGGPRVIRREVGPPGEGEPVKMELPPGGPPPGERKMMVRRGPNDMMFFRSGDKVEQWTPQELVTEAGLTNKLAQIEQPTKDEAEEAARMVGGDVETLYALRKSIMGIGFAGGPRREEGPEGRNARFANLTPEQRVQRARQRMKPMVQDEEVVIRKGPSK